MKNIIYSICCLFLLGCAKDNTLTNYEADNVFDGGFEKSVELSKLLTVVDHGWEFQVVGSRTNTSVLSYGYIKFDQETFDFALNNLPSYRKVKVGNPFRVADSYAMSKLFLSNGTGQQGSEFTQFVQQTDLIDSIYTYLGKRSDTLVFVGDDKGRVLTLVPTNSSSQQIYNDGHWQTIIDNFESFINLPRFFFNTSYNREEFFFYNDEANERLVFHTHKQDQESYTAHAISDILVYAEKIMLKHPVLIGDERFQVLEECDIQPTGLTFKGGFIKNESAPCYTNTDGVLALKTRNAGSFAPNLGFWTSKKGWSRRGELDFIKMSDIRADAMLMYQPQTALEGTIMVNRVGFMYISSSNTWMTFNGDKASFIKQTDNNKLTFDAFTWEWVGSRPVIVNEKHALNMELLKKPDGYIVLQTIGKKPVLVSASDALIWVIYDGR
ncbi:hypothetical protein [Sphingobacterium paucimobilis]|uniref:DUF4302 domain-containing protein n=1 Tax=Sphingobacterium paucimobilis HER1398 TaxID=1346330 RepID=U2HTM5_9SPHI|nr:hypothetical protein [Sphingobacterium paucimobilis]ERJ58867.1 hypothetical protein M472_08800 [Sphingobacterium paucimobilis HER1398]